MRLKRSKLVLLKLLLVLYRLLVTLVRVVCPPDTLLRVVWF